MKCIMNELFDNTQRLDFDNFIGSVLLLHNFGQIHFSFVILEVIIHIWNQLRKNIHKRSQHNIINCFWIGIIVSSQISVNQKHQTLN